MTRSPLIAAILNFVLGVVFIILAYYTVQRTGSWSIITWILLGFSTFDIVQAVRFYNVHREITRQ